MFRQNEDWYDAVKASQKKWGAPIHVQMAIMHQESKFQHDARPPKEYILWVIPWGRASSALGYAQVLDSTWAWYKKSTGNRWASRTNFDDAADFIGWYMNLTHKKNGVSKWNAEHQYLAYHEGHGGYAKKSYRKKPWLMRVAKKVQRNASRYRSQLKRCEKDLDSGWGWLPFF
ncbi:putative lipoprotein [Magnetofaba australis IT-1]|uniref:Putative lipoprotein n=2 Tax=Magnetofaba TaxID=1472292 RepID=A0A1Y2K0J7_9PROT|nr:putative lipoprotein [Magnetofaba australis IT-1]